MNLFYYSYYYCLLDLGKSRYISQTTQEDERPDLGNARIVVSGGRALKNAENFELIENLAEKLGAAGIIFYICVTMSHFRSPGFVIFCFVGFTILHSDLYS